MQARALGKLLKGMLCHVNVIPLNPTSGFDGQPTHRHGVEMFQQTLAEFGVRCCVSLPVHGAVAVSLFCAVFRIVELYACVVTRMRCC